MNHQSSVYIIRELGPDYDSTRDEIVEVDLEKIASTLSQRMAVAAFKSLKKKIVEYLVPRGKLPHVIEFDGEPLRIRVGDSDNNLLPIIKVKAVAPGCAKKVAHVLHGHVETQIVELRRRIRSAFLSHIESTMSSTEVDSLADISSARSKLIRDEIRSELGLEVDWNISPLEKAADWWRRLKEALPAEHEFTLNSENLADQVIWKMGLSVSSFRPSRYSMLEDWAQQGMSPKAIADRVMVRLGSIISEFHGSLQGKGISSEGNAIPRIAEEFGILMVVRSFEPMSARGTILGSIVHNPKIHMERVEQAMKALAEANGAYDVEVAKGGPNSIQANLKKDIVKFFEQRLKDAKAELTEAVKPVGNLMSGSAQEGSAGTANGNAHYIRMMEAGMKGSVPAAGTDLPQRIESGTVGADATDVEVT